MWKPTNVIVYVFWLNKQEACERLQKPLTIVEKNRAESLSSSQTTLNIQKYILELCVHSILTRIYDIVAKDERHILFFGPINQRLEREKQVPPPPICFVV